MDNENTADVIVVHITSNTNCSKRIEENLNFNLEFLIQELGLQILQCQNME